MCDDRLRDGATTRTIPEQPSDCANNDCNNDVRYGMHEDYDYYTNCKYRFRNRGLFTADRNLEGNTARFTRQNNNGARRGYECPEERDYYPYWHPSPWIDVMIMTNNASRCDFYVAESENVKGRFYCWLPDSWYHDKVKNGGNGNNGFIPNSNQTCEALNNPGSEMVTFLRREAQAQYAATQAAITREKLNCDQARALCTSLGDGVDGGGSACNAAFAASAINQTQLDGICNVCNVTDGSYLLHPWAICPTCIAASCRNALVARNLTVYNVTGCPVNFVQDDLSNGTYCIPANCVGNVLPFETMKRVDDCRAAVLANRYLFDGSSCVQRSFMSANCYASNIARARWVQQQSHADALKSQFPLPAPRCTNAPWSRPNHLGNGILQEGYTNFFNHSFWPHYHPHCAFRIRYNITTGDYAGLDPQDPTQVNSNLNRRAGGQPAKIDLTDYYGFPVEDTTQPWLNSRGYTFRQNPQVQIFDYYVKFQYCANGPQYATSNPAQCYQQRNGQPNNATTARDNAVTVFCPRPYSNGLLPPHGSNVQCRNATNGTVATRTTDGDFALQLAINTNQFGRTFQDRSHAYEQRRRSDDLRALCPNEIYALNVRGKRGNIVQTYPGTEYDFTPDRLQVAEDDCVHFQWTGSNTNPHNNDGQGQAGSDRHNVVLQEYVRGQGGRGVYNYGGYGANGFTWTTKDMKPGWEHWQRNASPTMGDMQCPPPSNPSLTTVHRYNWLKCVSVNCTWAQRACSNDPSTGVRRCNACPTGFAVDPSLDPLSSYCITTSAACVQADRPQNALTWTSGNDPILRTMYGSSPNYTQAQIGIPDALKHGTWGTSHPEHLDNVTFLGFSRQDLVNLAVQEHMQFGGQLEELNDAGTYFDLPPHKVSGKGTYNYMCTRNNNFSNRSQKAKIVVSESKQKATLIGQTGGTLGMNTESSFTGVLNTDTQVRANSDFWLQVPSNCLGQAAVVTMSATPNANQASDALLISPSGLVCQRPMQTTTLTPQGTRRRRDSVNGDTFYGSVWALNASAIAFHIWSNGTGLKTYFDNYYAANPSNPEPVIVVQFAIDGTGVVGQMNVRVNNNYEIEGIWNGSPDAMRSNVIAVEDGKMWMFVTIDSVVYAGQATPVTPVKQGITVRIPVSISMTYGKVYWLPDTPEGKACASGQRQDGCSSIRVEVANATVSEGEAVFEVGASQTSPAGGYYYVSEGSNLAIIIGVTVACFAVVVAGIGSAIYFRKHPDKWDAFKLWGPRRYKALKRSFASHV